MKTLRLDLESIAVETFATAPQPVQAAASFTRLCSLYDTCTNCLDDTCIC